MDPRVVVCIVPSIWNTTCSLIRLEQCSLSWHKLMGFFCLYFHGLAFRGLFFFSFLILDHLEFSGDILTFFSPLFYFFFIFALR